MEKIPSNIHQKFKKSNEIIRQQLVIISCILIEIFMKFHENIHHHGIIFAREVIG
jgi:hypothetical protein